MILNQTPIRRWTSIAVGALLAAMSLPSRGQEATDTGEPVVTERLAHPYSIDLLPDDPAPEAFEASPETAAGRARATPAAGADGFGPKTVTGDLFDRWLSTKESGITFGGRVTQYGFGVAGGIDRPVPPPLSHTGVIPCRCSHCRSLARG